ncbi:MAG: YchJ family metal-binding protein [Propionibacteriaceae bacterium]|nr:YchJ family metal-binding protein [Propionibacteriaceae bacterium]
MDGRRLPATAEELMRSRYAAFALGHADHLWRTWHPRTRPAEVDPGALSWLGLEILDVTGGGPADETGAVEFVAHYRQGKTRGRLHERSRFARRAGRWLYLDGEIE